MLPVSCLHPSAVNPTNNDYEEHSNMNENLRRLGDLSDFTVADDDPDVRGWTVRTRDGRQIGEVEELIVDPVARKVRYLEVGLDRKGFDLQRERRVSIPVQSAEISRNDRTVLLSGMSHDAIASLPESEYGIGSSTTTERAVTGAGEARHQQGRTAIPRTEEEMHVGKRRADVGEVVVGKHTETEHVSEPVSVERERVRVERRPVEGDARGRETQFRDDEVRIPVSEEELVVEKRPVVKEELVVSKETVSDTERVEGEVRKERFDVHKEGVVDENDRTRSRRGGH